MSPDIVFVQQYAVPYFGVLAVASRLLHKGYKVDVFIESLEAGLDALKRLNPRLIGISCMSPEHNWLINTSKAIRRELPHAAIIAGGVHAMLYPEEILRETEVDLVCHSEGEEVILKVLSELDKPSPDWGSIPGIAYRDGGNSVRSNARAEVVPYDEAILEERSFYYDRYPQIARDTVHRFISSRGCPYKCSFCYNAVLRDALKGKGIYVRQKSVENFMREISAQCGKYRVESIFFYDDLFTFNKKWLRRFLEAYKREINIPFMCTSRANLMDEETAGMLARAGCRTISFGIETGNAGLRKKVLNKDITDEEIIRCGTLLRKHGIMVQTANMFCLPDETIEDAFKTIELNIKARTNYAFTALFLPFPNTELTDYCIKRGYLKADYSLKDLPHSFLNYSVLSIPDKEYIMNVHRLAYFFIQWPWFYRIAKNTVRYKVLTPLFKRIFLLSNLLRHKEERGISLWAAVRYAWRLRKSF